MGAPSTGIWRSGPSATAPAGSAYDAPLASRAVNGCRRDDQRPLRRQRATRERRSSGSARAPCPGSRSRGCRRTSARPAPGPVRPVLAQPDAVAVTGAGQDEHRAAGRRRRCCVDRPATVARRHGHRRGGRHEGGRGNDCDDYEAIAHDVDLPQGLSSGSMTVLGRAPQALSRPEYCSLVVRAVLAGLDRLPPRAVVAVPVDGLRQPASPNECCGAQPSARSFASSIA